MKNQQLLKEPTIEMIVLDEPIDGWLYVVPSNSPLHKQTRLQKLRGICSRGVGRFAKAVRGH